MGTVLDYIREYGTCSFREKPLTEVDSLALCQLAYLKFDGMVPGAGERKRAVTLRSLKERPDYDKLFTDIRYETINRALAEGMLAVRRFQDLRINYYVNEVAAECETQFSAVTFLLNDGSAYVAYRGTDETIVGWKEDFNMAFLSPVPGQEYSVAYFNAVADRLKGPFYLGGHSKGGNLAVYCAMNCARRNQERIVRIYSLDGPGFRPEVLAESRYERIAERVVKILPRSSLVGLLFESDVRFQVVESNVKGLMQHDPYTWIVEGDRFRTARDSRLRGDNAVNRWLLSLSREQLRVSVDILFRVVSASRAENLMDLAAGWRRNAGGILAALQEIDGESAEVLRAVVRALLAAVRSGRQSKPAQLRRKA